MGAGPGRQGSFQPIHTARPPFFLINRVSLLDQPGAVQGAGAAKRTFDGEDRSGIM